MRAFMLGVVLLFGGCHRVSKADSEAGWAVALAYNEALKSDPLSARDLITAQSLQGVDLMVEEVVRRNPSFSSGLALQMAPVAAQPGQKYEVSREGDVLVFVVKEQGEGTVGALDAMKGNLIVTRTVVRKEAGQWKVQLDLNALANRIRLMR